MRLSLRLVCRVLIDTPEYRALVIRRFYRHRHYPMMTAWGSGQRWRQRAYTWVGDGNLGDKRPVPALNLFQPANAHAQTNTQAS